MQGALGHIAAQWVNFFAPARVYISEVDHHQLLSDAIIESHLLI
jgi:hypothetical protein